MGACAACGQENPEGARFCNACAAPLQPAGPRREERKVVPAPRPRRPHMDGLGLHPPRRRHTRQRPTTNRRLRAQHRSPGRARQILSQTPRLDPRLDARQLRRHACPSPARRVKSSRRPTHSISKKGYNTFRRHGRSWRDGPPRTEHAACLATLAAASFPGRRSGTDRRSPAPTSRPAS